MVHFEFANADVDSTIFVDSSKLCLVRIWRKGEFRPIKLAETRGQKQRTQTYEKLFLGVTSFETGSVSAVILKSAIDPCSVLSSTLGLVIVVIPREAFENARAILIS